MDESGGVLPHNLPEYQSEYHHFWYSSQVHHLSRKLSVKITQRGFIKIINGEKGQNACWIK